MTGNILFGAGALIVVAGLVIWITIVISRANRINHASSSRLSSDLRQLASDPEILRGGTGSTTVSAEPIMFSDDLPTEVSAIATAAVADEKALASGTEAEPAPVAEAVDAEPTAGASEKDAAASDAVAPTTAPLTGTEARLAKLNDLHARGVITDSELAAARLTALNE